MEKEIPDGNIHKRNAIAFYGTESPFSNFHKAPVTIETNDGSKHVFEFNEQYFMYHKALEFNDAQQIENILRPNQRPGQIKKYGRQVKGFKKSVWDVESRNAMFDGLFHKFTGNKTMHDALMSTSDKLLIETSPSDIIWGIGLADTNRDGFPAVDWMHLDKWRGTNWMGFILMDVRDAIRSVEKD